MKIERILKDDSDNLDETVISGPIESVHLEYMDTGHVWIAINSPDDPDEMRIVINLRTARNGKIYGYIERGL